MGNAGMFFQHLMNGLTLGGIYALIALGYTMVYGILKFINFAHGDILMVGAYIGLFVFDLLRGSSPLGPWWIAAFFIAMLLSMVCCAGIGMLIERVLFGTHSRKLEYPFDNSPISIGSVVITPHQIMVLVVAVVMMVLLKLFVGKSKMGKAMRATSLDGETAKLMGINSDMIISLTFGIGSALAACGGMLIALDYKVYATMGTMIGLKAFVAAVVGGIGNITGAMLGGFLLGLLETFGVAVFGIPQGFKDTIAFAVLIIILLVKPEGLLGKVEKEKV